MKALSERIASPEGKRKYVRALFATIADRYDLITVLLSFGQDRRWKRRLVRLASARPTDDVLDLATGTGDIAFSLIPLTRRVFGVDVTWRMVELAHAKGQMDAAPGRGPTFLVGDMLALPFADNSFNLVTTGYGLRNVTDLDAALGEIRRVLKSGGQMLSLDFNRPSNPVTRAIYLRYLAVVGGALGWLLHRDPDTYRYIPASIQTYLGAEGIVKRMESCGFQRVRHWPVLGGLMALHQAFKP
jgi:demethylmenaquinone methyltransferase/2-methoxy-6-polyprenyl-1,4-benzoquinol methylase